MVLMMALSMMMKPSVHEYGQRETVHAAAAAAVVENKRLLCIAFRDMLWCIAVGAVVPTIDARRDRNH